MKFINLTYLLFLASCSYLTPDHGDSWKENGIICMRDKMVERSLEKLIPTVDALAKMDTNIKKTNETVPGERLCFKRVFYRNSYTMVLFQNPKDINRNIYSTITGTKKNDLEAQECLARARADLKDLNADFALNILNLHNKKFEWLSNDPDIGPSKWLDCQKKQTPEYWASLGTMIHELNHELSNQNCLLSAQGQNPMCFNFPQKMPPISHASITQLRAKNKDHLKKLQNIQNLYLHQLGQNLNTLLDEMNAYALTASIQSKVIKHHGALAALDPVTQSRYAELLPLFQVLVARYFTSLKVTDPDLYKKIMSNPELKHPLELLFETGENIHNTWLSEMKSHNVSLHDFEKDLWDQYLRLKPALFPKK